MTSLTVQRSARAASISLALAIAGCAGAGSPPLIGPTSGSPPTGTLSPTAGRTQVQLSVTFPAQAASSAISRHPADISPSIRSLSFAVNGGTSTIVNAPAPTGSPQTVVTTVAAAPGSDAFAIADYDQPNAAGNVLGRVSQTNTILAGQLNTIAFTVNGQLAKIAIQAPSSAFVEGTLTSSVTLVGNAAQTFVAIPQDADGNTIVAPGAIPQLTVTSASPAAIVATSTTGNAFTLQAPAPSNAVAITVTGTDLDGKTVASAPFNVGALAAFYIADFTVQRIRVFDENGTPLALPATAFANITNPEGLAYLPGGPGTIVVTETANPGYPYIAAFDASGNAQPLPSNAFMGLSRPLFLTYAATAGAGRYFVPDFFTNSLAVFDASGAVVPLGAGSFAQMINPVAATYDPHDAQIYVTNDGADTVTTYTVGGALRGSAKVGSHPMGAVFDSNNNSIYVAYGGTLGAATDGQSAQVAGVTQFSETLMAVSHPGGFPNANAAALFTGIALDPYAKRVYVADAGNSTIDAFSEAGVPVVLPLGAFGTISATTSPKGDPMAILLVP